MNIVLSNGGFLYRWSQNKAKIGLIVGPLIFIFWKGLPITLSRVIRLVHSFNTFENTAREWTFLLNFLWWQLH